VAQARLNHPNVVTIYYVGRHQEEPFLAMELIEGLTIAERLKGGPIDYAEAIKIALEVVDALEHAHVFQIIHADIKPNNLLMGPNGNIKLSDFGLARIVSSEPEDRPAAGTPAYLAPELVDGQAASIQSDMYALGVTLFEMVFSRLPFQLTGTTLSERLQTHKLAAIEFPNPWPATIPNGFRSVIMRLLDKDPKRRFENYAELRGELQAVRPAATTIAGLSARAVAYAIDQATLLLGLAPFASVIVYLATRDIEYQWLMRLVALASVVVPGIFLYAMRQGVPSLGRYLLQLRICEENGLPPGREQLLTREILRNLLAWMIPLGAYFSLDYPPIFLIFVRIFGVFLLAELICLLFTRQRRT
jgi:uncharacterized RDD family membrane protein YckC